MTAADWTSNALALIALAFALWSAWRSRHRVTVSGRTTTEAVANTAGTPANFTYVLTTVRNIGKPITVEEVRFVHAEPRTDGDSVGWGSLPAPVAQTRQWLAAAGLPAAAAPDLPPSFGHSGCRLEDGESVTWACTVGTPTDWLAAGTKFRAVARLSNGRTVLSEPFWHTQSPNEGWPFDDTGAER